MNEDIRKKAGLFRKIFGVILVVVGLVGLFLPLVPFLVLFPLGLAMMGKDNAARMVKFLFRDFEKEEMKENTEKSTTEKTCQTLLEEYRALKRRTENLDFHGPMKPENIQDAGVDPDDITRLGDVVEKLEEECGEFLPDDRKMAIRKDNGLLSSLEL